jgi:hypothetical protein
MIEQAVIAIFGVGATWLSQDSRRDMQRWACVLGLLAQPAWFYATWKAEQWGIFALAFVYTAAWLRGAWTFWVRR